MVGSFYVFKKTFKIESYLIIKFNKIKIKKIQLEVANKQNKMNKNGFFSVIA